MAVAVAGTPARAQVDPERELARAEVEERTLLGDLSLIDRKLVDVELEVEQLRGRADALEREQALAEGELAEAEASLAELRREVAARARALYRVHRRGLARILFSADDPADLRRRSRYLLSILGADQRRFRDFTDKAASRRQILERSSTDRGALEAVQASLRLKESELRDARARKLALLDDVRTRRDLAARAAAELGVATVALGTRIRELTGATPGASLPATSFRALGGQLEWPVTGQVVRAFGRTADPVTGVVDDNPGVDIRAPYGTPVRAVADGLVQYTGLLEGFGLTIVLQHDAAYATVYAHASRVTVSPGQAVRAGDTLGTVGSTGLTSDEAKIHFQVRYHQTPQDPLVWLRPRGGGGSP